MLVIPVFAGEIPVVAGTPLTIDRFVIPDVPFGELQVEEVTVVLGSTFTPDQRRYWTIAPYYMDSDREFRLLAIAKTTATSRFTVNIPVTWTVEQKLEEGGAIVFRFTPSNAPDDLGTVTLQAVLRRGVR